MGGSAATAGGAGGRWETRVAGGRAVDNPPKCKSTMRKGIKAEQGSAADPTRSRGSRSCGARGGSCPSGAVGVVSWPPVPTPALS